MASTFIEKLSKLFTSSTNEEQVCVYPNLGPALTSEIIELLVSSEEPALSGRKTRITYDITTNTLRILIMPSIIHETAASWLIMQLPQWGMSGLLPAYFIQDIKVLPSPLVDNFLGRFAGSKKEPDCTVWPNGLPFPSIVLETGFSESLPMLMEDQEIWSEGTNYAVSIIILVKVYKPNAEGFVTAKCTITMYGSSGPTSVFAETLFPRPQTSLQHIPVTMLQIYRETLPQGIPPNRQVYLDLDALRRSLQDSITMRGLSV